MLGISGSDGIYTCQAPKENSPTGGLLRVLVARGGIFCPKQASSYWTPVPFRTKYLANTTLPMPIREYSKPLDANRFGA